MSSSSLRRGGRVAHELTLRARGAVERAALVAKGRGGGSDQLWTGGSFGLWATRAGRCHAEVFRSLKLATWRESSKASLPSTTFYPCRHQSADHQRLHSHKRRTAKSVGELPLLSLGGELFQPG